MAAAAAHAEYGGRLAPRAQEIHPNHDGRALGYLSEAWALVATAYTELAEKVRPGGEKYAA